ncbi:MAG: helix-turn-helix domain-containing protein [Desulfomicrobium sp.]|nr:helix-turn-helix domain-containing protein [Desulfomicrobium sp.]
MARTYISFPDLVGIVGEADAAALCREHGGCALYVTQTPERSALVGIISGCAIESLCAAYPGEELQLPSSPFMRLPIKQRVSAMLEAGASLSTVARECGCTTRYVHYVRRDIGMGGPPRPAPKKPEILKALREGLPPREIAESFGVSVDYVSNLRREYDIPRPEATQKTSTGTDGKA